MPKIKNTAAATLVETPAAAAAPLELVVAAPAAPAGKEKTSIIQITEKALAFFNELKSEFEGPGATKSTAMTSVEAMDLLIEVATDRRFKSIAVHDETGLPVYDSDGQPVIESVDLFAKSAERIFALRGKTTNRSKVDKLKAQLAALGVDVSKL